MSITCGNLLLLRPVFSRFFDSTISSESYARTTNSHRISKLGTYGLGSKAIPHSQSRGDGFERIIDGNGNSRNIDGKDLEAGSVTELQDIRRYSGDGIKVDTAVALSVEDIDKHRAVQKEVDPWRVDIRAAKSSS